MQIWLAIRTCLKDKIFVTGGRAGRAEFWWFTLFTILVRAAMYPLNLVGYVAIIFSIVSFLLFIGNYTSLTRRLHDTNRSIIHCFPLVVGLLLALVGFFTNVRLAVTVGEVLAGATLIYLLVLCALPGTPGPNKYGEPMPLGAKPAAPDAAAPDAPASRESQAPAATSEPNHAALKDKGAPKRQKQAPQPQATRPKHARKFK